MSNNFSGTRVLIWDFDGTLYRQIPALWEDIRASEIRVIMDHTGWPEEKAKEEFYKIYKVETPSGTTTVSKIARISSKVASIETSKYTEYHKYLHPDPALSGMFGRLTEYTHFMLVNGSQESVSRGLALLAVDPSVFREIITSEIIGVSKPSTKGFEYIMQKSGLPPEAHLMIGDREAVDLAPAKSLGMKTCLVWSDQKSDVADITVPTVYKLADVLG